MSKEISLPDYKLQDTNTKFVNNQLIHLEVFNNDESSQIIFR